MLFPSVPEDPLGWLGGLSRASFLWRKNTLPVGRLKSRGCDSEVACNGSLLGACRRLCGLLLLMTCWLDY